MPSRPRSRRKALATKVPAANSKASSPVWAISAEKRFRLRAKAKKLREACEGFESVFIQKMWQEMRNTLPKNGLLHGRDEQYWQDMYDQELSKSMTSGRAASAWRT